MDAWFSPASTGPHTSHVHCIVVSIYCCENRYKDGVRDGAGTIYHIGGGESHAVFEDGELVRHTQYRYPCRFGTAGRDTPSVTRHSRAGWWWRTCRASASSDVARCSDTRTSHSGFTWLQHPGRERLFAKISQVVAFYNGGTAAAA